MNYLLFVWIMSNRTWSQTKTELTISVRLPPNAAARDVRCSVVGDSVTVGLKSGVPLFSGELWGHISSNVWSVESGTFNLEIEKARAQFWPCALRGDPEIDVSELVAKDKKDREPAYKLPPGQGSCSRTHDHIVCAHARAMLATAASESTVAAEPRVSLRRSQTLEQPLVKLPIAKPLGSSKPSSHISICQSTTRTLQCTETMQARGGHSSGVPSQQTPTLSLQRPPLPNHTCPPLRCHQLRQPHHQGLHHRHPRRYLPAPLILRRRRRLWLVRMRAVKVRRGPSSGAPSQRIPSHLLRLPQPQLPAHQSTRGARWGASARCLRRAHHQHPSTAPPPKWQMAARAPRPLKRWHPPRINISGARCHRTEASKRGGMGQDTCAWAMQVRSLASRWQRRPWPTKATRCRSSHRLHFTGWAPVLCPTLVDQGHRQRHGFYMALASLSRVSRSWVLLWNLLDLD